jgi:5,10-methylenetetrahydrofolate reductase
VVGADIDDDEAADAFAAQALAAADAGADGIICETLPSTREALVALRGIKRAAPGLPVLICRRLDRDDPAELSEFATALSAAGADAIGLNCVRGPRAMRTALRRLLAASDLPVIARPNAGHPQRQGGQLVYHLDPQWLAEQVAGFVADGVGLVGGCCGVGPDHIAALAAARGQWQPGSTRSQPQSAPVATLPAPLTNPLLAAIAGDDFPVISIFAGHLDQVATSQAAVTLAAAGVSAIGLDGGWPGSGSANDWPLRLRHLADRSRKPALLTLTAGAISLSAAQDVLRAAHLLGVDTILIDDGVFAGESTACDGADTTQLLGLIGALNGGRDVAGSRIAEATAFAVGVRLGIDGMARASSYQAAGGDFCTIQPVYQPERFRAACVAYDADLPLMAEVLVLPNLAVAEEVDHEVPGLSVPVTLKQRLASDPSEDVKGVARFIMAWRTRLAGVCLLNADTDVSAAVAVVQAVRL